MKTLRRSLMSIVFPSILSTALLLFSAASSAQVSTIVGPTGSVLFGDSVAFLPNGNIVVADPRWSNASTAEMGAVYLYTSAGKLISTLTGSTAYDHVGAQIVVLSNGNFVVGSPDWNLSSTATFAGAVTWVNGATGLSGAVSATNSLVGSTKGDSVGDNSGVIALPNGNYLVLSESWANGSAAFAGAITWGSGTAGVKGAVSSTNSLVGTQEDDEVGLGDDVGPRVTILANGNVVVTSLFWANGSASNAGAATWINASSGNHGPLSSSNSIVGSSAGDEVGWGGVVALTNNHYVVSSPLWANGSASQVGAATWGNGNTGSSGAVSASNSLIGAQSGDQVSLLGVNLARGITALSNGNYVVASQQWANGSATGAGAATFCNGSAGTSGVVSTSNSLVGSSSNDGVGYGITALSNGNYVVSSDVWNNGSTTEVGAVTWGSGTTGISGAVSASNSILGVSSGDKIGVFVTALTNGNYVIGSPYWSNGATANVGAATWMNGSAAHTGNVSASNSLIGTTAGDVVSSRGIVALANGNYVVDSDQWSSSTHPNVGAVTWATGSSATVGTVSATNSLIGSNDSDQIGNPRVLALPNGNYVVSSNFWNGTAAQAGAATWGDGSRGTTSVVSSSNSLVGSSPQDMVGFDELVAFSNSNYLVVSFDWDNGSLVDAGATTEGRANGGTVGALTSENSVLGTTQFDGTYQSYDYDAAHDLLMVGQPLANIVVLFKTDLIFKNGFE